MFTFLPEEHRDRAVKHYRLKLLVVYIGLSCVLLATGFVLAIPSYAILFAKKQSALLEKQAATAHDVDASIAEEVKILKEEIAIAKTASGQIPVATLLDKVLSRKSQSVRISSITLKRGAETGIISVEGKASSRDALVAFSKSLQGEPAFTRVDLPVGSLAKSKDIPWMITISSKF
jgi:Tfp pilus assembly protein PilN